MTAYRTAPVEPTREMIARKILAEEYERGGDYGSYPSYAKLARSDTGAFTMCSIRAVERALSAAPSPQVGREEVARIIDPDTMRRGSDGRYIWSADVRSFPLAKADTILSLINGGK